MRLGRKRIAGGSSREQILREHWRKASANYYKRNRRKILKKHREGK